MGFLRYFFSIKKWNADPGQQAMARLFIEVIEGTKTPDDVVSLSKKWPVSEREDRLCHALSMVRVWRADLYPQAQAIFHLIHPNI